MRPLLGFHCEELGVNTEYILEKLGESGLIGFPAILILWI